MTAPGVAACLGLALCLVGALFMVDTTIVALGRNMAMPILAGALGAVWAVGSFLGGLVAGGLTGRPRLTVRVLLTLVGLVALVPTMPPVSDPALPWLVGLVLLLSGAAIAPTLAAANIVLGELAPPERRTEAFGWVATASTVGTFIAMPSSGLLLDHGGPAVAVGAAAAAGVLAVLLTLFIPAKVPVPALRG